MKKMKRLLPLLLTAISITTFSQIDENCMDAIYKAVPEGIDVDPSYCNIHYAYNCSIPEYLEIKVFRDLIQKEYRICINKSGDETKEKRIISCKNVTNLADTLVKKESEFWMPVRNNLTLLKKDVCKKSEERNKIISCLEFKIDEKLKMNYSIYRNKVSEVLKALENI